jgi:hypothetical protein
LRLALGHIDIRYALRGTPFDARLLVAPFLTRRFTANVWLRPPLTVNCPRLWRLSFPVLTRRTILPGSFVGLDMSVRNVVPTQQRAADIVLETPQISSLFPGNQARPAVDVPRIKAHRSFPCPHMFRPDRGAVGRGFCDARTKDLKPLVLAVSNDALIIAAVNVDDIRTGDAQVAPTFNVFPFGSSGHDVSSIATNGSHRASPTDDACVFLCTVHMAAQIVVPYIAARSEAPV